VFYKLYNYSFTNVMRVTSFCRTSHTQRITVFYQQKEFEKELVILMLYHQ